MALETSVTFAALTSNTVALSPNTLEVSTATLAIGNTNGDGCATSGAGPVAGFTATNLSPGVESAPVLFCLDNTGDSDLNLAVAIPQAFTGTLDPSQVTLKITCGSGSSTGALTEYTGGTPLGSLDSGTATDCSATATLNAGYSGGAGGQTLDAFAINFVGNTPS
jgi:hypothetical protein